MKGAVSFCSLLLLLMFLCGINSAYGTKELGSKAWNLERPLLQTRDEDPQYPDAFYDTGEQDRWPTEEELATYSGKRKYAGKRDYIMQSLEPYEEEHFGRREKKMAYRNSAFNANYDSGEQDQWPTMEELANNAGKRKHAGKREDYRMQGLEPYDGEHLVRRDNPNANYDSGEQDRWPTMEELAAYSGKRNVAGKRESYREQYPDPRDTEHLKSREDSEKKMTYWRSELGKGKQVPLQISKAAEDNLRQNLENSLFDLLSSTSRLPPGRRNMEDLKDLAVAADLLNRHRVLRNAEDVPAETNPEA